MVAERKAGAMGRQPRGRREDSLCDASRTAEGAWGASRGLFSNARERGLGSKSQIPDHQSFASVNDRSAVAVPTSVDHREGLEEREGWKSVRAGRA